MNKRYENAKCFGQNFTGKQIWTGDPESFWVQPLIQSRDRGKEFHLLKEGLKLYHGRFHREPTDRAATTKLAQLISDTLPYVAFKFVVLIFYSCLG